MIEQRLFYTIFFDRGTVLFCSAFHFCGCACSNLKQNRTQKFFTQFPYLVENRKSHCILYLPVSASIDKG